MALAKDVARWTWHKGRFEEIFGERYWFLAYAVAHQGVWITTADEVASLA